MGEDDFDKVFNAAVIALSALLAVAMLWVAAKGLRERAAERERAMPPAARRVIERVNREPGVAACNRIAAAVFGRVEDGK